MNNFKHKTHVGTIDKKQKHRDIKKPEKGETKASIPSIPMFPNIFRSETLHPKTLLAHTFHPETLHPETLIAQTFHPENLLAHTVHP